LASYRCSVQLGLARKEYVGGKTPRYLDYRVEIADVEILKFVSGMVNNGIINNEIIKPNLVKGNSVMLEFLEFIVG
jgi:hypothetical protein